MELVQLIQDVARAIKRIDERRRQAAMPGRARSINRASALIRKRRPSVLLFLNLPNLHHFDTRIDFKSASRIQLGDASAIWALALGLRGSEKPRRLM